MADGQRRVDGRRHFGQEDKDPGATLRAVRVGCFSYDGEIEASGWPTMRAI